MRRVTLWTCCLVFVPVLAHAVPITYTFSTHLSIVHSGLSPFVEMGSNMIWSFAIDDEASDLLPLDPAVGRYALGISSWSVGSLAGTATGGSIEFTDDLDFAGDSVRVDVSGMTFSTAEGFTPTRVHLVYANLSGTVFNSDDPPTSLDGFFGLTGLGMAFEGFPFLEDGLSVVGPVEVATATVPEPATVVLLCAGLVAMFRWRRSRG